METKQKFLIISFTVNLLLIAVLVGMNSGLWWSALAVSAVASIVLLLQRGGNSGSAMKMLVSVAPFLLLQAATAVYGINWCGEEIYIMIAETLSLDAGMVCLASVAAIVRIFVVESSFLWARLLRYISLVGVARMAVCNPLFAGAVLGYSLLVDIACLPGYFKRGRDQDAFRNTPSAIQLLLLLVVGLLLSAIGAEAPFTMFFAGDINVVAGIVLLVQALILLRVGTYAEEDIEDSFAFVVITWGYLLIRVLGLAFSWQVIVLAESVLVVMLSMRMPVGSKRKENSNALFEHLPVLIACLLLIPIMIRVMELQLLWLPVWLLVCFVVPGLFCSGLVELLQTQLATWGSLIGVLISLLGWEPRYVLAGVLVLTFLIAFVCVLNKWQEADVPVQMVRYIALIPVLLLVVLISHIVPYTVDVQASEEDSGILYVAVREGETALRLKSVTFGEETMEFPQEEEAVYQAQILAETGLLQMTAEDEEGREYHVSNLVFCPEAPDEALNEAEHSEE